VIGKTRFDVGLRDRRRQQNAPVRGRAGEFGNRDIRRARQRGSLVHRGAAPVGQHEAAIAAIARDAVGKCKGEHDAGRELPRPLRGLFSFMQGASLLPSPLRGRDG